MPSKPRFNRPFSTFTRSRAGRGRTAVAALLFVATGPLGCATAEPAEASAKPFVVDHEPARADAASRLAAAAAAEARRAPANVAAELPPGLDPEVLAPADASRARLDRAAALAALVPPAAPAAAESPEDDDAPDDADRWAALRLYTQGRQAALDGRHLVAITKLQEAMGHDPSSSAIRRELARSFLALGNTPRALALSQMNLDRDPGDTEARLTLGLAAAERRRPEEAVALLGREWLDASGRRFAHDPLAETVAAATLAEALRELGYLRASIEFARDALDVPTQLSIGTVYENRINIIYRQRAETWRGIGDMHVRLGEFEQALDAYSVSAALPSHDPGALWARVAYAQLRLGRPRSAQYTALLAVQGSGAQIGDREIRLCRYLADNAAPVDLLAQAVDDLYRRHPDEATHARAAAALLPPEKSQALLRDFLNRRPDDFEVASQLLAWMGRDDLGAAGALVVDLVSDHPGLAEQLAGGLIAASPLRTPILEAVEGLADTPARAELLSRLQVQVEALGPAWWTAEAARRRWPEHTSLRLLHVDLASRLGEPRLVETALTAVRDLDDARSWRVRSEALRRIERGERAADAARTAVERDPADARNHLALARALAQLASTATEEAEITRYAESAVEAAERGIAIAPDRDEPYDVLLELYMPGAALGDGARLRDVASRLVSANPESRLYTLLVARESIGQRRYERALESMLGLYESDPTDSSSLILAVACWVQMQKLDDAERWLDRQRERRPGDPILLDQWSRVLVERGRGEDVVETLLASAAADPRNEAIERVLEGVLRTLDRHDEALEIGERRLTSRPEGHRRELALAALYTRSHRTDDALPHLRWLHENRADAPADMMTSALAVCEGLDAEDPAVPELALAIARDIIGREPRSSLRLYGSAMLAMSRLGRLGAEFDDLTRRAVTSAPGAADDSIRMALQWRQLAQTMADRNAAAAAASAVRGRLLAVPPLDAEARTLLALVAIAADASAGGRAGHTMNMLRELDLRGRSMVLGDGEDPIDLIESFYQASLTYMLVGEDAGADQILQEVVRMAPEHAMAMNNLAYLRLEAEDLAGVGDLEVLETLIESAHRRAPDDANVLDTLGWLRYKQARFDDAPAPPGNVEGRPIESERGAISLIRQALDDSEEPSAEVCDHLGDALYRGGDVDGAVALWQRAIAILSDPERRQQRVQEFLGIQTGFWGLLVSDPRAMYDRDYGSVLTRAQAKVEAVGRGESPPVAPTFTELAAR